MKNKGFAWIGGMAAIIGVYYLGSYLIEYLTERFIPLVKQFLYFL